MPYTKIITIALASVLLAGGCSDDGEGSPESGLLGALGKVRATDSTRKYVEYGDVAKGKALADGDRRFLSLTGFGLGNLRDHYKLVAEDLRFDPMAMREAVSAGSPPDWAAIAWGDYDVDAVNGRFAELGVDRSEGGGSTTWTASPDGEIRLDSPLVEMAGPNTLNNVRTGPGSFAFSPKRDTLAWVTEPGGDTLAKDPTIKAIAGCLGDVMAAIITRETGSETLAVGVRAPSASEVTDVICAAPGTEAMRDHVTGQLADGKSPRTGQPWRELLPNAKVELLADPVPVVRVTATPGAENPPGRPVQMLMAAELSELLGS